MPIYFALRAIRDFPTHAVVGDAVVTPGAIAGGLRVGFAKIRRARVAVVAVAGGGAFPEPSGVAEPSKNKRPLRATLHAT
jgi:hypothetical protein